MTESTLFPSKFAQSDSAPLHRTLTLGGKEYTIKKLSLGGFKRVFAALGDLPKEALDEIMDLDTKDTQGMVKAILRVVSLSSDAIYSVLEAFTTVPAKRWENELGLDDVMVAIAAILEVNNIDRVKKGWAMAAALFRQQNGKKPSAKSSTSTPAQ